MLRLSQASTRSLPLLSPPLFRAQRRALAELAPQQPSAASASTPVPPIVPGKRSAKKEGTIEDIFQNLTPSTDKPPLPPRFAALKREICKDPVALEQSWRGVLKELEGATEEIAERGNEVGGLVGGAVRLC